LDVDLWRDKSKFKVSRGNKHCPVDRTGLMEVRYDESKTKLIFVKCAKGLVRRGEFKQIMNYLKQKSDYEICTTILKISYYNYGKFSPGLEHLETNWKIF